MPAQNHPHSGRMSSVIHLGGVFFLTFFCLVFLMMVLNVMFDYHFADLCKF